MIDRIWHVRGSLALAPGQSSDEAFERLDPLFDQTGTSRERAGDTLTFRKKDPAAQDRMSVFDHGSLQVEQGEAGPELRWHLTSRALLFCFVAPLFFIGMAQLTLALPKPAKPPEAAAKPGAPKKPKVAMHPIDKALGAPAPEDDKDKKDKKDGKDEKKRSPTPAYVFAGIFAALYLIGRFLEAWLVKSLFRKRLRGA